MNGGVELFTEGSDTISNSLPNYWHDMSSYHYLLLRRLKQTDAEFSLTSAPEDTSPEEQTHVIMSYVIHPAVIKFDSLVAQTIVEGSPRGPRSRTSFVLSYFS